MRALLSRLNSVFQNMRQRSRARNCRKPRLETLETRQVLTTPNLIPLLNIPDLESHSQSQYDLYLDFDGHAEHLRRGGIGDNIIATDTRGSFSIDANRRSFNEQEISVINAVWARVAEDFAPFNVNVTTNEPEPNRFSEGTAVRIVIGGDNDFWYDGSSWGVHYHGFPHIAFVFSDDQVEWWNGGRSTDSLAAAIAGTVSHEAGHAYGLAHQEFYHADGSQPLDDPVDPTDFNPEYNPGQRSGPGSEINSDWAPIMGGGASGKRDTWHNGPTSSVNRRQDDMAVLGAKLGFRADDHGSSVPTATWLPTLGNTIRGSGVIGTVGDTDYFAFWHGGGRVTLRVDVASQGANLDARLELRNSNGVLMRDPSGRSQIADAEFSLGTSIVVDLPQGMYHVVVGSHGAYGDVGQYILTGTGVSSSGYSTNGPQVIYSSPENPLLDPFVRGQVSIIVTFDKPIDGRSFSTADVTFISPSGRRFQAGRVELMPGAHGGRTFRVQAAMPENGTYRMQIGPFVRDRFGNNLDQDRDGIHGEANGDVYSTIAINRRMPNLNTLGRQFGLPTY